MRKFFKEGSAVSYAVMYLAILGIAIFYQHLEKKDLQTSAVKVTKIFGGEKEIPKVSEKPKAIFSEEIVTVQPGDNIVNLFDISTEEAVALGKRERLKVDTVAGLIRVIVPVGFRFKLIHFEDGTYEIKKDQTQLLKKRLEIFKLNKKINKKPHKLVAFLLSFSDDFINNTIFLCFVCRHVIITIGIFGNLGE